MRQTLVSIPHDWLGGGLLVVWLLFGIVIVGLQFWKYRWNKETSGTFVVVLVGAAVIYFLLPLIEIQIPDPSDPEGERVIKEGLAIRGYGFMFLLGAVAGVGIGLYRAAQIKIDGDRILGLAFWMFVIGIIGARLFFVIQYRDMFMDDGKIRWGAVINMTEGGLVVYGSVIAALIAFLVYVRVHKLPVFAVADVIAPAMVLGLALGRIGCLLNGCCYGGICEWPVAIEFPPGSPPYMDQYERGELVGITGPYDEKTGWFEVESVEENSFATMAGVKKGDRIRLDRINPDHLRRADKQEEFNSTAFIEIEGRAPYEFQMNDLPRRAKPVHPTQIYSAINAGLLCMLGWFFFPFRKNDGEVFALLMMLYPISRFILEGVRVDEGGKFGTNLSISQWVSIGMFVTGVVLFTAIRLHKGGRAEGPDEPPLPNLDKK